MNETREHSEAQEAAVQPDAEGLQGQGAPVTSRPHMSRHERRAYDKREFISRGEKVTNFWTYAGVDWLLNAAAGVKFAHWADRTDRGRELWSKPISNFFERHLKPFIKDEALLAKSVGTGNMFMSIIAGGMATIPPLLVLENNKVKKSIVKSIDKMIYGKDTVENDPKFANAYQEIEQAPKKNFGVGMVTRFIALSPLLAIVLYPKTRMLSNKYYFEPLANSTKWLADKVGIRPKKLLKVNPEFGNSDWDYIHASLAMDFGLGPFYAVMHSYFYNKFAGKPKALHTPDGQGDIPPAPPAEVMPKDEAAPNKARVVQEIPAPVIEQHHGRVEHHDTVVPTADLSAAVS